MKRPRTGGYTLIELVTAVGLFALVMTLSSGAYLLMIDLGRQAQGVSTGINSLSFALETMTRSIRTGTSYQCGNSGGDCLDGADNISFRDPNGADVTYAHGYQASDVSIRTIAKNGITLTDPSVSISSLQFYVSGTGTITAGDYSQPYVTIVVSGTVLSGPDRSPQSFTIETGAAMRGVDLTVTLPPSEIPQLPTCTLSAAPTPILSGGSSVLSWTTQNATTFSLDQGIGVVTPAAEGTQSVAPTETKTYTGTATNNAGTDTCNALVEVTPQGTPQ